MDKENYNDNDLKMYENLQPEEIVDRIMDTHVLDTNLYRRRSRQNEQNDSSSVDWSGGVSEDTMVGRRTRRYAQEDADQQYTMRFQTIQSENDNYQSGYDNNMYQTQKIDFTPQYSHHHQNYDDSQQPEYERQDAYDYNQQQEYERQDTNYNSYDSYNQQQEYGPSQDTNYNVYQNSYQEEYSQNTYHENQQRKGPFMQEIEISIPGNSGNIQEDVPEGRRKRHSNYDDYDLTRGAKQIDLDELYSDDFDDEESISFRPGKKLSIVFSIILIAFIGFLGFRCISLGGKLKEAQKIIAENEDLSSKYETLQMDNLKLEEELNNLKAGGAAPAEGEGEGEGDSQNNTANTTTSDDPGNFDWYTVTDGDSSWWALAQKFYGDGTKYTKILEANGKKESDYVKTGDKLKIPKE